MLAPVLEDAGLAVYKPLLAEALLQRGRLAMVTGDADGAHADLKRAAHLAVAAGHDIVAAHALLRDLFVRAEMQHHPHEAVEDAGLIAAMVDRVDDRTVCAEFLNNLGVVQMDAGTSSSTASRR